MKAITFQAPEKLRCETIDDPGVVDPGDAVVRVSLAAICGSDLHVYKGRERGLDAGTVMGHEFLGEVVDRGADVRLPLGTKVVSPFTTSCGACYYCRGGLTCRCEAGAVFGWVQDGRGLQGVQAEYVRVPLADSTLVTVPDDAPEEEVLFAGDVLSTGFYAADRGGVGPGSMAAVVGCGPVGLMAIVGARELGAERVFAVDPVAERRELAVRFGAEPIDPASVDAAQTLRDATAGRGADVVLEAVGNESATRLAVDLVRPGGVISAVGVHNEPSFGFAPVELYDKNLTYQLGRCPARHYLERMIDLIRARRYDLSAIVSHRLPLDDGVRAYDVFDRKLDGCTKVLLRP